MNIRYTLVNDSHPITRGLFTGYRKNGTFTRAQVKLFRETWGLQNIETENAIIATLNNRVVGFFRFTFYTETLYACGTFVSPAARGKHVALNMWAYAINTFSPKSLDIPVATEAGRELVKKIKQVFPKLVVEEYYTEDDDGKPLWFGE